MKKAFLIAAVLIAAIIVSCVDPVAPDLTQPDANITAGSVTRTIAFTATAAEDGTITLEYAPPAPVPVKSGRALSLPLAKAATDFYEVIFAEVDNTNPATPVVGKVWRRNFREGETVRMTIDPGEYNDDDHQAYMFAGLHASNTLLAIGKISQIEYKDGEIDDGTAILNPVAGSTRAAGDFAIDATTFKVTFELAALTTDIKNDELSTFKTWDPANDTDATPDNELNDHYEDGESVLFATICNDQVPVFLIPQDTAITGSITINGECTDVIRFNPLSVPIFDSRGFFEYGIDVPMAQVLVEIETAAQAIWTNAGAFSGAQGLSIPITITPQQKSINGTLTYVDGLAVFEYTIPVYNFSNKASENLVPFTQWYLRGGLMNSNYDLGPDKDSQGGTIILGVGDVRGFKIFDQPDEDGFIVSPSGPNR